MKYQIIVYGNNDHNSQVFNRFTWQFQKDSDYDCYFDNKQDAESRMNAARDAWNEYDDIEIIEIEWEG